RIILPCMAVFGTAFASLGLLTPNLFHLYATFVVLGIVGNGTTQMGYSRAVSTWFDERRGLALALVMAGVGTGSIIFPPLAQWIIDHHGWRAAYFTLGGTVLLSGIPLTAMFVRERREETIHSRSSFDGTTVANAVRSVVFWLIIGMLFLSSISINGAITHLSPLLTDRGISSSNAALAASVLGLCSFAGRLLTGYVLDRYFGPHVSFCLL